MPPPQLGPRTRFEAPVVEQRAGARRRSRTGAYQELPGGVGRGEHYVEAPFGDWLRKRFVDPDPEDERRVLGMTGQIQLQRAREDLARKHRFLYAQQRALGQRSVEQDRPHGFGAVLHGVAGLPHAAEAGVEHKLSDVQEAMQGLVWDRPAQRGWEPRSPEYRALKMGGATAKEINELYAGRSLANLMTTGRTSDPLGAAAEGILLYPALRPLRGARALVTAFGAGVRGAETAAEIEARLGPEEAKWLARARRNIELGRPVTPRQQQVLNKVEEVQTRLGRAREAYRGVLQGPTLARRAITPAVSKVRTRTFRARDMEVKIPAAKARTGRGFEMLADAGRRAAGGRVPLLKTEEQRAFEETNRLVKYGNRIKEAKIRRLQQLDMKLNDEKQYAIRLSLEGSTPEKAIDHHMALASAPGTTEEQKAFHVIHASIIQKAEKYLRVGADGNVELIPNAPKYMAEARDLLTQIAERRQEDYKDIFALTDQAIANRVSGPARVRAGARWREAEDQLVMDLQASPLRQQAEQEARVLAARQTDDPERQRIAVDALMNLWDANMRVIARDAHGDQAEWHQFQDLIRFGRGPIPEEALTQGTIIQAKPYWDEILKGASPEVLAKIPDRGEITVNDLVQAQRVAYEQGDRETVRTLQHEIRNEFRSSQFGPLFQQRDLPIDVGDPIGGKYYPFYSKVGRVVASWKPGEKIGAAELKGRLGKANVRQEEMDMAQIDNFLSGKKSVTREEAQAWIDENFLHLEENVRWQHPPPGVPHEQQTVSGSKAIHGGTSWTWPGSADPETQYGEISIRLPEEKYGQMYSLPTSHFPEYNTIVHIRFTTREVNGKRMLFIEEIQSDWHKAGIKRGWRPANPEDDPDYQAVVARQEEARVDAEQKTEAVERVGDWIWGQRYGPQTLGDMPAPVGTLGIERALGINLSDADSVSVFSQNLTRISKARRANAMGLGDYHFQLRRDYYDEGVEIGFNYPVEEPGVTGPTGVAEDFHVVRSGIKDSDYWPHELARSDYEADAAPRLARANAERNASVEMDGWQRLMSISDEDYVALLDRVTELRIALAGQRMAREEVRNFAARGRGGITQMPFEDSWHELGFKRMLAWAVDNGFEKVGWTMGKHQAERYDLANFFTRIEVEGGHSSIPEVGSDEFYDALGRSRESDDYYEYLSERVPPEPMREDFREKAQENLEDDYPQADDFEDSEEYSAALEQWEMEVDQEENDLFNEAYYEWESERESAEMSADEDWEQEFASRWPEEAEYYGYDGYDEGYLIRGTRADGGGVAEEEVGESSLDDYIGPDLAERVRQGETYFEGNDLAMGEGAAQAASAQEFYDKKFRSFIGKYMKKWGTAPRLEKMGTRRVTTLYDVFYKPHASTAEVGKSFVSLRQAQQRLDQVLRDDAQNPNFRIVDRASGDVLRDHFGTSEAAQHELDVYILPQAKADTDYVVEQTPAYTKDDFQIIPRSEEKWVGAEPQKATFSVRERRDTTEGSWFWETVIHWPDGEEQATESFNTWAEAQARVNQLTEEQAANVQAPSGFPYGEEVHSIDLPTAPEKDWNSFIQYKLGLGEKVTRHDPKALEEFQAWHPESEFQTFMRGGQPVSGPPLQQRGGILKTGVEKGAIWQNPQYAMRSVINFTEHGDLTTFVHEVFGHWSPRWLPDAQKRSLIKYGREMANKTNPTRLVQTGNFDPTLGDLDREAAEHIADAMEFYIREGRGPTPVKRAVTSLAPHFREAYDGFDVPDLTPQLRKVFDRMFAHERVKGGKLVGAEDIPNYSVARIAYEPGRPLPVGVMERKVAAVSQYLLSGGKTIAKGPVDQALNHQYRGTALMTGYFTANAIRPTTKDALLAVRVTTLHRVREDLLKAASDLPTSYTDIAIKVDPDKSTPKGVQTILNKMRELDHAKGGKLTDKDMELIDLDILEEGSRDIFPNQMNDADGEPMDIRLWAQRALNDQEPIEGIKWIPVEWLDSSGLTPPPGWKGTLSKTIAQGNPGLTAWDFINDVNKLAVLYLNPAYVPINFIGNLVMNFMQQGAFAVPNLWKSALMHQWLDGWERKMIDNEMGNGLTASLGTLRGRRMNVINTTLGHYANQAVDLIPRRAAFLHEARRAGYRSKEEIRSLIRAADAGEERAVEDMKLIAYRANDAIVDYERMSPLERAITSRLIFFYPWLKGATRYTMRFALEHPVQAIALMLVAEHAYTYQKQQLGDVPFYEGFDVPLATKAIGAQVGIPGIYDGKQLGDLSQVFGDYSWVQGKYPMVIDARQMLTFSTPVDLYRAAHGLVTGNANSPSFFDNLTPFLSNSITTLQGYDSFRHKEVPVSWETFFRQNFEGLPQYREWKQLAPAAWGGMSDKERRRIQENAINPRTSEQDWWRLFGSGLAPAPFSYEVAEKRTLENASMKIRHVKELEKASEKYHLGPVTAQIEEQVGEYDDMNHEIKQGMTPMESLQVIAKYYKRHSELRHADDLDSLIERYATTDAKVSHLSDYLRHNLEYHAWRDYWRMRHYVNRAEEHYARGHLSG